MEYQATCKCNYANAYPYAIGPHLGVAYQITPKTVFRAGGAISYAAVSDQAGLNSSAGDFYTIPAPAYGVSAGALKNGDPEGVGNRLRESGGPLAEFHSVLPGSPRRRA